MLFFQDSKIEGIYIHKVGNKSQEEFYQFSDGKFDLDQQSDDTKGCLMGFFYSPFKKNQNVYRLFHPNNELSLNEVWCSVTDFFEGAYTLRETSQFLATHLYDVGVHPKIKSGEFYMVHFKGIQFEGETCDAIGLFKSENKENFLQVKPDQNGDFQINLTANAININHLDKAALIINTEKEDGYKVLIGDCGNSLETGYWKDDFLNLKARHDDYQQTTNIIKVAKSFILEELDNTFELERADKIEMLNKTIQYFKEKETIDLKEFVEEVFGDGDQVSSLFNDFKERFTSGYDIVIENEFNISDTAVKKVTPSLKSVIKLDKNFHIYVHGKRDYLEKGYDDEKGMNYYKVYFENEGYNH